MMRTQQRQDMREMGWATGATNGITSAPELIRGREESIPMDNLYRIVSLSLLFFDAIVKPFDRMIEEEEYELFRV